MNDSPALFRTLPAGAASDGLLRAPLSAILARWPASYAPVARAAIERRPPSGLVHFKGEAQLSKWHARWLAARVAAVMRVDDRELIHLVDADGPAR